MQHNVIIETKQFAGGHFRAYGVQGPDWAIGFHAASNDRLAAFAAARVHVEDLSPFPADTFKFIHCEA